jgi:LmbE family N-acetylglucosaminyl deacetylase
MIVLSPHLDDAVLSCGQLLAAHPESTVVSVFAGAPEGTVVTDYDQRSGFTSAQDAVQVRRAEDTHAGGLLRYTSVHWDFLDGQYGQPQDGDAIADQLRILFDRNRDELFLIPLGLVHQDHEQLARLIHHVVPPRTTHVVIYEDLPSRVLYPESVKHTLDRTPGSWTLAEAYKLGIGPIEVKEAAVRCFRSQAWALPWHECLVPERFWERAV